mmetsp:Transcript_2694/g.9014  ORF Transcript_2694/g.9014 Transcript_2694/m.9014 type:complete len:357 (-) Transcript_2694:360-1430(-)
MRPQWRWTAWTAVPPTPQAPATNADLGLTCLPLRLTLDGGACAVSMIGSGAVRLTPVDLVAAGLPGLAGAGALLFLGGGLGAGPAAAAAVGGAMEERFVLGAAGGWAGAAGIGGGSRLAAGKGSGAGMSAAAAVDCVDPALQVGPAGAHAGLVGRGGGGTPRPGATAAATAARVAVRAAEAASSLEGGSWHMVRCLSGLACAAGAGAAEGRGVSALDAAAGAGRRTSNGAAVRVTASAMTAAAAAVAADASASPVVVRGGSVAELRLGDGLIMAEMDSFVLVPSTTLPKWSSQAPRATLSSTADESGSGSAGEPQPRSTGAYGAGSSGLLKSHSAVSSASSLSVGTGEACRVGSRA